MEELRNISRKYVPGVLLQVRSSTGIRIGIGRETWQSLDWRFTQLRIDGRNFSLGSARMDACPMVVSCRYSRRTEARPHQLLDELVLGRRRAGFCWSACSWRTW